MGNVWECLGYITGKQSAQEGEERGGREGEQCYTLGKIRCTPGSVDGQTTTRFPEGGV